MTTEEPVTNGAAEPKEDDSAPAEKVATEEAAPEMEGSSKEEAPKKAVKAKKGKKGKKGAATTENGTDGEKKDGDIEIVAEIKKKPIKKKIPQWATLSDKALAATKPSKLAGPSGTNGITVIIDAIKKCANAKGTASYISIKKYVQKTNPNWPKMTFKSQLRRSVDKGCVKKIKDSYKVISETPVTKKAPTVNVSKKVTKGRSKTVALPKAGPLEDLFPHIFTWVCEPKEASYGLIRKYLEKHYPKLSIDAPFKKAILNMVAKGQLDQITGKGASGTFQLEGGAKKTGTTYEDPIEDAIIASNEPKDASVSALRHYLSEFHKEYNVAERPKVLKNALERAEAKGWLVRVTGKGFSGTFRLGHPYIPSPRDLWREEYVDPDAEKPKKPAKKKKVVDSSDEEESSSDESESEEEDSDDDSDSEESEPEYVPKATKRGAPKSRSAAPAKKAKVVKKPPPKKKAPAKPAAKKSSPAKKKPAAKKSTPKKKPADSESEDEESEPEYVPKPTKRGTPSKAAAKSTPAKSTPKKKPAAKSNKKTKSKKK